MTSLSQHIKINLSRVSELIFDLRSVKHAYKFFVINKHSMYYLKHEHECFIRYKMRGAAENKGEFRFEPISVFVYLLALSQSERVDLYYFRF